LAEPIIAARPEDLRAEFNDASYYTSAGVRADIEETVVWTGQPNPASNQPVGTESQIVYYSRDGMPVAIVHQYVLPDRTLGASGRPDPKWVVVRGNGTLVVQSR
jgi:hypothetical protein